MVLWKNMNIHSVPVMWVVGNINEPLLFCYTGHRKPKEYSTIIKGERSKGTAPIHHSFFFVLELYKMHNPAFPSGSQGSEASGSKAKAGFDIHPLLRCACGRLAAVFRAGTPRNEGRRFIKCPKKVIESNELSYFCFL
jgi:hypothetical protein